MDTKNSTAPEPHPSTDESPHACLEGWVFITFEDDEEREASYRCRRCADNA